MIICRPVCDNCAFYEAYVECQVCDEVFCQECWGQIHFGGRRKEHTFRALYDYYGKRVDYGDAEFPSKWPSEVIQDEIQGWMLRVAPIREPIEIIGDWEKYSDVEATDGSTSTTWKEFYFNRQTFETSYVPPTDDLRNDGGSSSQQNSYSNPPFLLSHNHTHPPLSRDTFSAPGQPDMFSTTTFKNSSFKTPDSEFRNFSSSQSQFHKFRNSNKMNLTLDLSGLESVAGLSTAHSSESSYMQKPEKKKK